MEHFYSTPTKHNLLNFVVKYYLGDVNEGIARGQ